MTWKIPAENLSLIKENEAIKTQLEHLIFGLLSQPILLDLIANFTVFESKKSENPIRRCQ